MFTAILVCTKSFSLLCSAAHILFSSPRPVGFRPRSRIPDLLLLFKICFSCLLMAMIECFIHMVYDHHAMASPPSLGSLRQASVFVCDGRGTLLTANPLPHFFPQRFVSGHTCDEIYVLRHGKVGRIVDAVVWPESHEHVEVLVRAACKHNVCLMPFGGTDALPTSGQLRSHSENSRAQVFSFCKRALSTSPHTRTIWRTIAHPTLMLTTCKRCLYSSIHPRLPPRGYKCDGCA